ncbi:MAG: YbaB/EbfC family nucleoid-associated protein [Alphaproteobacteria bacterium]|nr:YbaB/EbfC family nucleoid-associated protein [Alphaproteobacteria bacterium]
MTNIAQMMQKAQKFKQKMQEMQDRVKEMDIPGAAGGGLVSCVVTGSYELKSIKIDPSLVKPEETDVLEDLIVAAVNDARAQAERIMTGETQKLMAEMGLPPNMELPF